LWTSCPKDKESYLTWKKVKRSDDYLDYSRFIRFNPSSQKFDSALFYFYHFKKKMMNISPPHPGDCFNNCIDVLVNQSGQVLMNGQLIPFDSIRTTAYSFILNKNNTVDLPDKKVFTDHLGNEIELSKGVFIINHHPLKTSHLQENVIEIVKGIDDYKLFVAKQLYNSDFDNLNKTRKSVLDSMLSTRLIFRNLEDEPNPEPPKDLKEIDSIKIENKEPELKTGS
jgi:hypothetical protein